MKRIINSEILKIPFKQSFNHHSATRNSTETIIVEIKNENNVTGFGESCPRLYVTAETIDSANTFITTNSYLFEKIQSIDDLYKLIAEQNTNINKNPSAWCALEMAGLDLLAREKNLTLEKLLGIENAKTESQAPYTAVIGITSLPKAIIQLFFYKLYNFNHFKIKLSGDSLKDMKIIRTISYFAKSIRVDANNFFKTTNEAIEYLTPIAPYIWAIEEPLAPNDYKAMEEISKALKIKIILDESFLNNESINKIINKQAVYIPNLRISKMGGILRTLEVIKSLEENNFQWILGSHVGETSLLNRASLIILKKNPKNLLALEGGFSTHLLSYDPFYPNLKFGFGACLKNLSAIGKNGLGMIFIKKTKTRKS